MSNQTADLLEVRLADLRPTQMTVGFAEVAQKRKAWEAAKHADPEVAPPRQSFPGVLGPRDRIYITDHHHLGLALIEAGVEACFVAIAHDFSKTAKSEFWTLMDHLALVHPYDAAGHRCAFEAMPKRLTRMADDPYRSLAAAVRADGGFAKETAPFAEFLWADFFRRRISAHELADKPARALADALALSHTPEARHLPGWSGVATTG